MQVFHALFYSIMRTKKNKWIHNPKINVKYDLAKMGALGVIIRCMQDFQDFRCILCKESFQPPYALPYLLPCTHSLCTRCLQRAITQKQNRIICPDDLESNSIAEIRTDPSSRRALERLVRQHKNYNQNNQLLCIQSLSKHFESALEQQQQQRKDLLALVDQIYKTQIQRLQLQQLRLHQELDTPFVLVKEWKQNLKNYLSALKTAHKPYQSSEIHAQLAYYIEQGRKVKQQIKYFINFDYEQLANSLIIQPACLESDFSFRNWLNTGKKSAVQSISSHLIKEKESGQDKQNMRKTFQKQKKGINSNFSTNQSGHRKQTQVLNITQSKLPFKRFVSEPVQTRKNSYNTEQKNFTNILKEPLRQRLKIDVNQAQTHRQEILLREQVAQQLKLQASSLNSYFNDTKNLFIYSPDDTPQIINSGMEYDQLLLTEKQEKKAWIKGEYNFLVDWGMEEGGRKKSLQVKKKQAFDWQQQSNNYIRRMQTQRIEHALQAATVTNNSFQLFNHSLQGIGISGILSKLDWNKIQVLKLVKTNLSDSQFNQILNYSLNSTLYSLVLSGNSLTERTLDALLHFSSLNSTLKNVYLSRNNINCLRGHTRQKCSLLRQAGINLYI